MSDQRHAPHEQHNPARGEHERLDTSSVGEPLSHSAAQPGPAADRQPAAVDPLAAHGEGSGVRSSLALLLDTDLFFSVKVTDTLKHIGYSTRTLRRVEDFALALVADRPAFALVNTGARGLDWRSGIAAAVAAGVPVVAFGSHVDLATQREARDLGATSVIANSKLAADLPGVVARTLRRAAGDTQSDAPAPPGGET